MGRKSPYSEREKQEILDDIRRGESPEKFLSRRKCEGRPVDASSAQLRRWIRFGVAKAKPGPKPGREDPGILHTIRLTLIALWLYWVAGWSDKRPVGPTGLQRKLAKKCKGVGKIYSVRQIGERCKHIQDFLLSLTDKEYSELCGILDRYPSRTHQRRLIWQIDASLLPVMVYVPDAGASVIQTVWVTIVLDVASRLIVGWHVHFGTPNCLDTIRALLHAMTPKSGLGLPGWGIPWIVQSDNGSIFDGLFFRALRALGILAKKSRPATPTDNSYIERTIGTIKGLMNFDLEASIQGRLPASLGAHDVYLPADIYESITEAIIDYNLHRHRALNLSPAKAWCRAWPHEIERPFNQSLIDKALSFREPATIIDSRVKLPDGSVYDADIPPAFRFADMDVRTSVTKEETVIELWAETKRITRFRHPAPEIVQIAERLRPPLREGFFATTSKTSDAGQDEGSSLSSAEKTPAQAHPKKNVILQSPCPLSRYA